MLHDHDAAAGFSLAGFAEQFRQLIRPGFDIMGTTPHGSSFPSV
jgi:hypothetical protein